MSDTLTDSDREHLDKMARQSANSAETDET
jgi:hypothetical protein